MCPRQSPDLAPLHALLEARAVAFERACSRSVMFMHSHFHKLTTFDPAARSRDLSAYALNGGETNAWSTAVVPATATRPSGESIMRPSQNQQTACG